MKKALLVVFLDTHFTELRRVAHCLKDSGRYAPEFFFARAYPTLARDVMACMDLGFPCYDQHGRRCLARAQRPQQAAPAESSVSLPRRVWRWLYPWLSNSLPWAWREYHQLQDMVGRFLREQGVDLLVLAEENVGYATQIWTQTAQAAGLPVLVLPYTVADASEPAGAVKHIREYQLNRWPNRLAGKRYPHWVYEHEARDLHCGLGYDAAKMLIIPNGFDLTRYKPDAAARQSLREELGLPLETLLIGAVGRFDPQKDYPTLIAAAGWLHAAHPDIHFLLCGKGLSAKNAELTGWIEARGLQKHFHLLGQRSDMPHITAGLDLATSSSAYGEAFSNVIGEAMACEVPFVATDVGDAALILGETGKVVPPREAAALAAAWNALLSLPAGELAALGAAARERIEEKFSLPVVAGQYAALYRELAEKGSSI